MGFEVSKLTPVLDRLMMRDDDKAIRDQVEDMWARYEPTLPANEKVKAIRQITGANKVSACHTFHQLFWEMWLHDHLSGIEYELLIRNSAGPDFAFDINGQRVWVEAIAPQL